MTQVVVVSRSLPPDTGGYQRQLSLLLPLLAETGLAIEAVGAVRSPPPDGVPLGWPGVRTHVVPAWRVPRRIRGIADGAVLVLALARGLLRRRSGPVSLLLLSPNMVGGAVLFAVWSRCVGRVVARFPGAGDVRRLARRRSVHCAKRGGIRLVALSPQLRSEAVAVGLGPVALVPNAVEVMPYRPERRGPARFLFVGRLIATKRLDTLLDAWATAHTALPHWELHIVGSGRGERDAVDEEVAARAAQLPRVRLLGTVADARECLGPEAILVHPSTREGLPNAVLEAMAAGTPVVASAAAMASWFTELPPFMPWDGASPASLARTMVDVAGQPERLARLAQDARAFVAEAHAPAVVADAYARLLTA